MNKFPKRVLFISMLLIVNILMLASCKSKDIYDDENLDYSIDINNENAKVLSIKDVENNSDDSDNELKLSKVIKNISDISIYNILITLRFKEHNAFTFLASVSHNTWSTPAVRLPLLDAR